MEREIRYTVLKNADLNRFLSPADQHALNRIESIIAASRKAEGRGELQAVVIEKDWPEYEPAYKMIEARVEADRRREAAIAPLMSIVCSPSQASATVNKIYEAVAAGKIPGVELSK